VFIGSLIRLVGFTWSWACQDERPVSDEFVRYMRAEQKQKMLGWRRVFRKSP